MGFLIDTCVWIDVERGRVSPADVARFTKTEAVYISPVTLAELTFGLKWLATKEFGYTGWRRLTVSERNLSSSLMNIRVKFSGGSPQRSVSGKRP